MIGGNLAIESEGCCRLSAALLQTGQEPRSLAMRPRMGVPRPMFFEHPRKLDPTRLRRIFVILPAETVGSEQVGFRSFGVIGKLLGQFQQIRRGLVPLS